MRRHILKPACVGAMMLLMMGLQPGMAQAQQAGGLANPDFSYPHVASDYVHVDDHTGRMMHDTVGQADLGRFGWRTTQANHLVEIRCGMNAPGCMDAHAEIVAEEPGCYLYQDVPTMPGSMYVIRLKHGSRFTSHADAMSVMIGPPGHESPILMRRVGGPDAHGDVGTVLRSTPAPEYGGTWDSYESVEPYTIPPGQHTTRFTFKSVDAASEREGNLIDDVDFTVAYPLRYHPNGGVGPTPQRR